MTKSSFLPIKLRPFFALIFGLAVTCLHAQIPDYVPTEGLVGWYPFDGNADDESGNENHGVVNGAMLTEDRFGQENVAYSFDGINDYIEVAHDDMLNSMPMSASLTSPFLVSMILSGLMSR